MVLSIVQTPGTRRQQDGGASSRTTAAAGQLAPPDVSRFRHCLHTSEQDFAMGVKGGPAWPSGVVPELTSGHVRPAQVYWYPYPLVPAARPGTLGDLAQRRRGRDREPAPAQPPGDLPDVCRPGTQPLR
jgi:hypothetical protein